MAVKKHRAGAGRPPAERQKKQPKDLSGRRQREKVSLADEQKALREIEENSKKIEN